MFEQIKSRVTLALEELFASASLSCGDLFVVGCSTSEIAGGVIGKQSTPEAARAVYEAVMPFLASRGVCLAAQCCEHLNRALVVEKSYAQENRLLVVNAVPQPDAGGAFASFAYGAMTAPVAVASVQAQAGMDIGDTLIGMHLVPVAVPVRSQVKKIGGANLVLARTRAPFIGGERAKYAEI